jgi:imidazoleglycerol-phosphate dehydratase
MDETLVRVAADLSGRPYLVYNVKAKRERVGKLDSELIEEFWKAVVSHARMNLHIELLYGRNMHHIFEAVFKAAARALCLASRIDPRVQGVPSTKGVI